MIIDAFQKEKRMGRLNFKMVFQFEEENGDYLLPSTKYISTSPLFLASNRPLCIQ